MDCFKFFHCRKTLTVNRKSHRKSALLPKRRALRNLQRKQKFLVQQQLKVGNIEIRLSLESAGKKTKEGQEMMGYLCLEKGVKKELTEKQGYEVVLRYINEQNKPFNALTIFENLHKEVKKAYVVRILAQLAQEWMLVV